MSSPPNHPTGHPKQIASGASFSISASTGRLSRNAVTCLIVGGTALMVGVVASYFTSEQQRLKTFELSLGIIDPQGRFFNVLKGQTNINLGDRPHFKRAMAGQSTVLDSSISRSPGKPIIVFAAPIWSAIVQDPARKPIGIASVPIGIEKAIAQKMVNRQPVSQ